jgi:hypothetical protein
MLMLVLMLCGDTCIMLGEIYPGRGNCYVVHGKRVGSASRV